ncbi:hypothetical protein [Pseudomonas frederiksbergensis]|uniref:hypothetical protein n=1 Tax=Pseudomonas frederiksbergensis TaxID=104087 RepID=UPI00157C448A|nr:hypothetical protein [Pseudomonas frederiksbergensis]
MVEGLYEDSNRVYVIHYSCESFYENATGESKRVTSIAIRNLKSGQTKSWSIHKEAELTKQLGNMVEGLDKFEKSMLKGYFQFLERHKDCRFLHWNMRDENFGFYALEHRFRVLGGKPFELQDDKKVDLARELVALYGRNYAPHKDSRGRKGRIMALAELNNASDQDALPGADEAAAFVNEEYIKMHQSTLRKLDLFANFFERTHDKFLKTASNWWDRNGAHPVVVIEAMKEHPVYTVLIVLSPLAISFVNFSSFLKWAKNVLAS